MTEVVGQPLGDVDIGGRAVASGDLDADVAVGVFEDADPLAAVGMADLHAWAIVGVFEVSNVGSLAVVGRDVGLFRHVRSTEGAEIA